LTGGVGNVDLDDFFNSNLFKHAQHLFVHHDTNLIIYDVNQENNNN